MYKPLSQKEAIFNIVLIIGLFAVGAVLDVILSDAETWLEAGLLCMSIPSVITFYRACKSGRMGTVFVFDSFESYSTFIFVRFFMKIILFIVVFIVIALPLTVYKFIRSIIYLILKR